jgi:hypothetical protein
MRVQPPGAHRMIVIFVALGLAGCGYDEGHNALAPRTDIRSVGAPDPTTGGTIVFPFDPANFAAGVPNPFFPLTRGTHWSYRQQTPDGVETSEVDVTFDTKRILTVTTAVVHDQVFLNGELSEDTFDWYAPDNDGNVWYFGEDTKEIVGGVPVSTAGSWQAGKNGAQAGIIMLAHPMTGDTYLQENSPGVVGDMARVKSLNETVTVPLNTFSGCLKTQEFTSLEPGARAFKFYAAGVGTVLEAENHKGGPVELITFSKP